MASEHHVAKVRVLNMVTGKELLAERAFPCQNFSHAVCAALGSRASRPVKLFHNGEPVEDDFKVAPDDSIVLAALVTETFTMDDRKRLLNELETAKSKRNLERVFLGMTEAARDDKEIVLYAVKTNGILLQTASEVIQDDEEVVLAAVKQNGSAFRYASHGLRDNKKFVVTAQENVPVIPRKTGYMYPNHVEYMRYDCKQNATEKVQAELKRDELWFWQVLWGDLSGLVSQLCGPQE